MRSATIVALSVGLLAIGGWVYAQQQLPPVQLLPLPAPEAIVSGPDIGVRIESAGPGRVIGTLVVRLKDGSWVPVQFGAGGVHKLGTN